MNRYSFLGFLAFLFSLVSTNSFAQFQGDVFRPYNDATVLDLNNQPKALAWAGGLNHPQFAMADLNMDGKKDLVVYEDYVGVKTFISIGGGVFKYDVSYEANFPQLRGYLKLIDFNGDNIEDLIHRNNKGIGVYHGYYSSGSLKFKYYKDLEYFLQGSGNINAYVAPSSIPGAADIDGDGDIDFIAYDVFGSTITYYKNCQKENNLPNDSIKICVEDMCWGKTLQNYERQQVLAYQCSDWGTTCKGCDRGQGKTTHGSNTLCLIDIDLDGDLDHFNGNESFSDIQFFYNGRRDFNTIDSAIAEDTIWSSNGHAMYMPIYPAAFALDVDRDNDLDLLFSPFDQNTENYHSASFYENTAPAGQKPNFVYRTNTYLIEDMIDLGSASYPVLYDFNRDGKKDILVGSDGYYDDQTGTLKSRISYYRSAESSQGVAFKLITDDFLNLGTQGFVGTALAIGDLDNDTLDDLVIGRSDGTFAFFKNMAATPADTPIWQLTIDTIIDVANGNKVLDVGDYATPCIYDIDGDGKNDLVSGNQAGDLYYFNNYGNISGFVGLKETSQNLAGIKIVKTNHPYVYTAPYIGTMDNTNKDYLVIGTEWGQIYRYDSFKNGATQAVMLDSNYSYIDVKSRATPAFANLDNDAKDLHEAIIGNTLGGLTYYRQDFPVTVDNVIANNADVTIYPNPAKNTLHINWDGTVNEGNVEVKLISITGQQIAQKTFNAKDVTGTIGLNNIPSGMYYCIVKFGDTKTVLPVSILK